MEGGILRLAFRFLSAVVGVIYMTVLIICRALYHGTKVWTFKPGRRHGIGRPDAAASTSNAAGPDDIEPYHYERLPGERHVRLIQVRSREGTIEVNIHAVDLDHFMAGYLYRAVSYTWGSQLADRYIVADGKRLPVTATCEDMIRHLPEKPALWLWIDAICIDQASNEEKSSQIPLMADIYSRAFMVNIWLGDEAEGSDVVFNYMWLLWCCISLPQSLSRRPKNFIHRIITKKGHEAYFRDIMRRRWWRRVWTIQEAVLAKSVAQTGWYAACVVNCGPNLEIPLQCLTGGLLDFAAVHDHIRHDYPFNNIAWTQYMLAHHIPQLAVDRRLNNEAYSMDLCMLMYRSRSCTSFDPRDRVYGLYGILKVLGLSLPSPSYLKTKDEVYWEFTAAACQQTQSLELLSLVTSLGAKLDAPSWVPDYSEKFRVGDRLGSHNAHLNSEAVFRFQKHDSELVVRGRLVDMVASRSDLAPWQPDAPGPDGLVEDGLLVNLTEGYAQTVRAFRDWYRVLIEKGQLNQYGDYRGLFCAFGEVLAAGHAGAVLGGPEIVDAAAMRWVALLQPGDSLEEELARMRETPEIKAAFYSDGHHHDKSSDVTRDEEWRTLAILKSDPVTRFIHHTIWMLMRDKTFFVTTRGFVGTAHASIGDGDAIVLLAGVDRPVVLRYDKETNETRFVCPAYIAAMMKGECWNDEAGSMGEFILS